MSIALVFASRPNGGWYAGSRGSARRTARVNRPALWPGIIP
jgi:hypothetical protein